METLLLPFSPLRKCYSNLLVPLVDASHLHLLSRSTLAALGQLFFSSLFAAGRCHLVPWRGSSVVAHGLLGRLETRSPKWFFLDFSPRQARFLRVCYVFLSEKVIQVPCNHHVLDSLFVIRTGSPRRFEKVVGSPFLENLRGHCFLHVSTPGSGDDIVSLDTRFDVMRC